MQYKERLNLHLSDNIINAINSRYVQWAEEDKIKIKIILRKIVKTWTGPN